MYSMSKNQVEKLLDLHKKLHSYIVKKYPDAFVLENENPEDDDEDYDFKDIEDEDTELDFGDPAIMIMESNDNYKGMNIEIRPLSGYNGMLNNDQKNFINRSIKDNKKLIISDDYKHLVKCVNQYMMSKRIPKTQTEEPVRPGRLSQINKNYYRSGKHKKSGNKLQRLIEKQIDENNPKLKALKALKELKELKYDKTDLRFPLLKEILYNNIIWRQELNYF